MGHQAAGVGFERQAQCRIRVADAGAQFDAAAGLGVAAVVAQTEFQGGFQGAVFAQGERSRALQQSTDPAGPRCCAGESDDRIRSHLHPHRVGAQGQFVAVCIEDHAAGAQRAHPQSGVGIVDGAGPPFGQPQFAPAVAEHAPYRESVVERVASVGVNGGQGRLEQAAGGAGVRSCHVIAGRREGALALAEGHRDTGHPALALAVHAQGGGGDIALQRQAFFGAAEARCGALAPGGPVGRALAVRAPGCRAIQRPIRFTVLAERPLERGAGKQLAPAGTAGGVAAGRSNYAGESRPERVPCRRAGIARGQGRRPRLGRRHVARYIQPPACHRHLRSPRAGLRQPTADRLHRLVRRRASEARQPCLGQRIAVLDGSVGHAVENTCTDGIGKPQGHSLALLVVLVLQVVQHRDLDRPGRGAQREGDHAALGHVIDVGLCVAVLGRVVHGHRDAPRPGQRHHEVQRCTRGLVNGHVGYREHGGLVRVGHVDLGDMLRVLGLRQAPHADGLVHLAVV